MFTNQIYQFSHAKKYFNIARVLVGIFLICVSSFLFSTDSIAGGKLIMSAPKSGELTGLSANEIVADMGKGWNLGNTFDATGGNRRDVMSQETSWGNPVVCKELIDGVAKAGFKTIRIPTTWYKFVKTLDGKYTIVPEFLERIKTVVDYAYDNDLYVVLNLHHEEWVNDPEIETNYVAIGKELVAVWQQIADYFADYDQHLIFEGMNEPRAVGKSYEWNGTSKCYEAINYLDRLFVETIRNNKKGHNFERALMIPGYAASSSTAVLKSIELPDYDNLIISVHCYSPYNFCLQDTQTTFDSHKAADTADITRMLSDLKLLFTDNGIPVIIGECGCTNTDDNYYERAKWLSYFSRVTKEAGIPAILWDNGSKGNKGGECHNYFERATGDVYEQILIDAFVDGICNEPVIEPCDRVIDFEPYRDGQTTVMVTPALAGFTNNKLSNVAKINATEGATLGFSLKVESGIVNHIAYLDVTEYAGRTVNITSKVMSEEANSVCFGTNDKADGIVDGISNSESGDCVAARFEIDTPNEWKELSLQVEVAGEGMTFVYWQGLEDCTFYIDDISIDMQGDEDEENENVSKPQNAVNDNNAESNEEKKIGWGKQLSLFGCIVAMILMLATVMMYISDNFKPKK